jgi:ryanodine receptor 2
MTYNPTPIETANVVLPAQLLDLTERLAEHAHDVWAGQRIADGWSYGAHRDDNSKRHPCLVPYESLPETEKQYDRLMAMQTLKAIVALGYRIEK